ncbi:type I restriction enzyme HsdR N-terminal domain-containing protein [Galbibacter sp.]|uniref:type I restriction enzyme HsdR N-terminal domain-containing protein n=1 Tax=Galbibacter sp. TaxID=2918471 RepID=UPI002CFDA8EE|nr:type I restriction enzyme HsdR N-terminal domain-containing protein [Galbibacter sp.]HLV62223.1 type I restriction enzyme HsdR N-terminal domain-containing protein [Galbibacter sp.]
MQQLSFPSYEFRFKNSKNKVYIFDEIRKKFILLQPEEWVRQHVVKYLIHQKNYPLSLINVEKVLTVNGLKKRYDIIVYNSDGSIELIVECKAPTISISQATFDQIARYNSALHGNFLMVTNGLEHYYCKMDYEKEKYIFLKEIPPYML